MAEKALLVQIARCVWLARFWSMVVLRWYGTFEGGAVSRKQTALQCRARRYLGVWRRSTSESRTATFARVAYNVRYSAR